MNETPAPKTPWRARIATLIALAALGAYGAYVGLTTEVTAEITHFLPSDDDRDLARLTADLTRSDLNRSMTLTVEAPNRRTAAVATRELATRLARSEDIEWVRSGPSDELQEAFYALYFARRFAFVSDRPQDDLQTRLSDEGLRSSARELRSRLVGPTGSFVRTIAPEDPLLAFPLHLERMRDAQEAGLEVLDGQFVTADGRHGVLFLATVASPFDTAAQQQVQSRIAREFAAVEARHGGRLRLEQSGIHRFAIRSEATIRSDITRVSVFSTIGVFLFLLLIFRSPRYFLLSSVPLAVGFVVAMGATQAMFGRVHGLTLAFGSTTIGVAIDYVSHYFNHHVLRPHPLGPWHSLRAIAPGLFLAAGTTIAGLAGIAWTGFPGVRELAAFTSIGVAASLLATAALLPPWLPARPVPTRMHLAITKASARLLDRMRGSKLLLSMFPIASIAICAVALTQLTWVDDIRALDGMDPAMRAEDERVRARVSRVDSGRFVIAFADDEETALRRNDEAWTRLSAARTAGELEQLRSIHSLLWSQRLQRENLRALRSSPRLAERTAAALESEGFVASAFEPFAEALAHDVEPLTYAELADSPLAALVAPFRVPLGDRVAFITYTRGADVAALEERLAGLEGVRVFDQTRFMNRAYGQFRARTLELVGFGLIGVFLMVFLRYRKFGLSLAAVLPAVLASATALAIVVLLGEQPNLMHLVALLLVLSMGEDYGVFMVESINGHEDPAEAFVSIVVACLTTVLSFGLLAMSTNPAMRALGMVTALGVLLSMLLAPTAWLLATPRQRSLRS